jgi:hypothetical protein
MTPAHASTAFFTVASIALALMILLAFHLTMLSSLVNRCLAGFVACVVASPLMLVAHVGLAITMAAVGVACALPACVLAENHDDDGGGGDGGGGSGPVDGDPDPGSDPERWDEFERDFWSHVERTRAVVTV